MNKQFYLLRKDLNLSQEQMGKKLGVTRSSISNMETGRFKITDTMVKLICNEFGVNEKWLRNGTGKMYNIPENDLVAKATKLLDEDDSGFKTFLEIYSQLNPENRKLFIKMGLELLNNINDILDNHKLK